MIRGGGHECPVQPGTAFRLKMLECPLKVCLIFWAVMPAGVFTLEQENQLRGQAGGPIFTCKADLLPGAQHCWLATIAPHFIHVGQQKIDELPIAISVHLVSRQLESHMRRPGVQAFFERGQ